MQLIHDNQTFSRSTRLTLCSDSCSCNVNLTVTQQISPSFFRSVSWYTLFFVRGFMFTAGWSLYLSPGCGAGCRNAVSSPYSPFRSACFHLNRKASSLGCLWESPDSAVEGSSKSAGTRLSSSSWTETQEDKQKLFSNSKWLYLYLFCDNNNNNNLNFVFCSKRILRC